MSTFPKVEVEIIALAEMVIEGLKRMSEDFPSPPVAVEVLEAKLAEYKAGLLGRTEVDGILYSSN